jgi:hypothetical protein
MKKIAQLATSDYYCGGEERMQHANGEKNVSNMPHR